MKTKIRIEDLKKIFVESSNACKCQFDQINKLLLSAKFDKVDNARKGYTELWDKTNKLQDFLKENSINYWTNYGNKTIECPNFLIVSIHSRYN